LHITNVFLLLLLQLTVASLTAFQELSVGTSLLFATKRYLAVVVNKRWYGILDECFWVFG